ncbi:MAG: hypothetical protein ACJAZ1_002544 [Yoonia sp.]|jgi:hypothetical protein
MKSGLKPLEVGAMRQKIGPMFRLMLIVISTVGMVLSFNARIASHDLISSIEMAAQQHSEIETHGHSHDEFDDIVQAYHGHAHDVLDHDHSTALLPPRRSAEVFVPTRSDWVTANSSLLGRDGFDLDRPPRA